MQEVSGSIPLGSTIRNIAAFSRRRILFGTLVDEVSSTGVFGVLE
jgi:hypothetical protein